MIALTLIVMMTMTVSVQSIAVSIVLMKITTKVIIFISIVIMVMIIVKKILVTIDGADCDQQRCHTLQLPQAPIFLFVQTQNENHRERVGFSAWSHFI